MFNFKIVPILVVALTLLLLWLFVRFKPRVRISKIISRPLAMFLIVSLAIASGSLVSAQTTTPQSLKDVAIPKPDNLGEFIKDENAAIQLGKALFWDEQVGSDGITSCATCHFHAGADNRSKNQISPGLLQVNDQGGDDPDTTFQIGSPNYQLTPDDFPFHKLFNPLKPRTDGENGVNGSNVERTTNDVASSQGVTNAEFVDVVPGQAQDVVTVQPDPDGFQVNGINTRRVEPRNTPTVINAVFNRLQFWDGRAKDTFNGVNISGNEDPDAVVLQSNWLGNKVEFTGISLNNASLASQAVGPPLSSFEMTADGRTFEEIGDKFGNSQGKQLKRKTQNLSFKGRWKKARRLFMRRRGKKLRSLRPLGQQLVARNDSVLGRQSRYPRPGLKYGSYEQLIRNAFRDKWWKSSNNIIVRVDSETGEPTIVNQRGGPKETNEYTMMEYNFPLLFGLAVQEYEATLVSDETPFDKFMEGDTSALSDAQQRGLALFNNNGCNFCHVAPEFTRATVRPLIPAIGFFNIGVTNRTDDPGAGNGSFKSPTLRNVELTAPYMHNGGLATLEQVVEFYARGGDFPNALPVLDGSDPPGPAGPTDNLLNAPDSEQKRDDLVAFLKALTDERVRYEKAPFDHPQLHIPNGHPGDENSVTDRGDGTATDDMVVIPAVGRNGRTTPPPNFLEES